MSEASHEGPLGAVYAAGGVEDIARLYDGWSADYEAFMARAGYRHPAICAALLARHLPRGAAPLLDAGAGTGLLGDWLGILGWPQVEALDISEGMLAVAARRGVYARMHRLALGRPLPFADGAYAGIVASGVFTTGHVGAEGLDELVRICRPGGALVLTVKTTLWDGGFAGKVADLSAAGLVQEVERTAPYSSMPGEAGTVPSLALVLRRR
jgi:SAM-dependent methyltransferase